MTKLLSSVTGVLSLLSFVIGATAAPSDPLEARQCTTTILAPTDLIIFDLAQPNEPGWSSAPSFEAALNNDKSGYKMIVRFSPPTTGSCAWVMSLPADRLENEAMWGRPVWGPVLLSFFGVPPGGYNPGDKLSELEIKPGPFGVNAIQPGIQTIHAEPCNQIGGELFVEVPEWIGESMWVYWPQDIQPSNVTNSLGIYMRVQTC
ncbi:hypothetical protein B0T26DRAFT_707552 [Lasiosphaeria miniovina]|uniref:Ubiquitin 3 binding protein But2 C-terminal domain-containing protein n=1 Tax=Lasiosphaeria miniovina TaxID=1954250 RepID=A0AA40DUI1_9PEZI|nr:uncharacterized protein B0T26DRAFT_707552 [Lasiosphaeria miniovina]KAK0716869.1 hypothetical protein B0T26DRAFT_707552 [Lasiosphaeria miniovina]